MYCAIVKNQFFVSAAVVVTSYYKSRCNCQRSFLLDFELFENGLKEIKRET